MFHGRFFFCRGFSLILVAVLMSQVRMSSCALNKCFLFPCTLLLAKLSVHLSVPRPCFVVFDLRIQRALPVELCTCHPCSVLLAIRIMISDCRVFALEAGLWLEFMDRDVASLSGTGDDQT